MVEVAEMSNNTAFRRHTRLLLVSLWMYLGGPLVWGAWMVWRLKLYRLDEFLALLWPTGFLLLLAFLGAHFFTSIEGMFLSGFIAL